MPEKRIALVVPDFSIYGGLPTMTLFLRRILCGSGRYQADIVSISTSAGDEASLRLRSPSTWLTGPRVVEGTWKGLPFRHVGATATELEFQRYRPRRILTEILDGYDLVQVVAGAPAWAMVARKVRRPVVLWTATLVELERGPLLARSMGMAHLGRRWMTEIAVRLDHRAPGLVAHTFGLNSPLVDRIRRWVEPSRVSLALPGVDTDVFRPGDGRSDDFILSVARFSDARKNLAMLLRAYHRLRQRMPSAPRLVLASIDAPAPEDWALVGSLGLADHVELRLGLTAGELAPLYRDAALFALTSHEEGLGIVILEAMASGTPVVSTRCGGPEEVVGDGETGFLTPLDDDEAFAARMAEVLGSPSLRRAMGEAGRRVAEDRFSLEAAGRVFLDKYDELLASPGRPAGPGDAVPSGRGEGRDRRAGVDVRAR